MYYKRVSEYVSTKNVGDKTIIRKYSVVKSEVNIFNGGENVEVPSYGIEISEQVFVNNVVQKEFGDVVAHISPYHDKVEDIAKLLRDKDLSPLHLSDIIDDVYYIYIADYDEYAKECRIAI
ncbi:DUF6514 family protein [Thermoanaerobacterium sp. RBIITD]|uniref:DUF6514 family protein n=1 Tax=Thermoanaerobacterium sp. RBIITD TaxID=1550240 RepID=UPI000BB7F862|nr:DUF6514 family protein [Thermoanaerobacterium sp. RBIITD]SNX54511.1 hypothetical protein SAMN05660242_2209 [Thermoanaerobacterium sp. RBIITD]